MVMKIDHDSCCKKAEKIANFYAAWSIIPVRSVYRVRHPRPFIFYYHCALFNLIPSAPPKKKGGWVQNDAKQEENDRFGRMGCVPPLQNQILDKNVISPDSPGVVGKKWKEKSNAEC